MRASLCLAVLCLAACGGPATTDDMGPLPTDGGASDLGADAPAPDLGHDAGGPCHDDLDHDGHVSTACGGDDCDDTDPSVYTGNLEVCDPAGHDEDCDPSTLGPDHDGDGEVSTLCCDRQPDATLRCGTDCDDARPTINTMAVEACNGLDDDCNGLVDDGVVASTFHPDCDGDLFGGMGTASMTMMGCTAPTDPPAACGGRGGWSTNATDCDDTRASVSPGAVEICDGLDNNCDGHVDEGVPGYFPDCDRDGYGAIGTLVVCALPSLPPDVCPTGGWSPTTDDCDDARPTVHPHATETCDSVDDDCDGTVDGAPADAWCGGPLSSASTCASGACSSTCLGAAVDCGPAPDCDDLLASPLHCGSCAHACGAPACAGGACTEDFTQLQVASLSTCARRASGRATCWGYDNASQFGLGAPHMLAPLPAVDMGHTNVSAIAGNGASGDSIFCTLHPDHTITCTGANTYGQCGTGTTSGGVFSPSPVVGISDATGVSVGDHCCALHTGGTVSCWGESDNGQIGDGSSDPAPRVLPATVVGITDAVQVLAGRKHSCALHAGGTVSCWGINNQGDLGTGDLVNSNTPRAVVGITDAVKLVTAGKGTCALRSNGHIACWGENRSGQLGDGTTTDTPTPVAVATITDAVDVAMGEGFGCAIHADHTVSCWGSNAVGTLGDGSRTSSLAPVTVVGLTDAVEIAAGLDHVCARHANDVITCWGGNAYGMLDDGTTIDHLTPEDILAR